MSWTDMMRSGGVDAIVFDFPRCLPVNTRTGDFRDYDGDDRLLSRDS